MSEWAGSMGEQAATIVRDVRLATRRLGHMPLFTFVVVLTLAVGIGANSAIFGLVKGVLLDPLPYDEPDRLVSVEASAPGQGQDVLPQSAALHFTYEDEAELIDRIGLWRQTGVTVLGFGEPRQLDAMLVTAGTLPALRVRPALGRLFRPADDTADAPPTVALDHAYWQRQFGGDPDVIGRTLEASGQLREIIGVLPRGFRFLDRQPALCLPFRYDRSTITVGNFTLSSIARLKPGVTIEAATTDLARLLPHAVEMFPGGLTLQFLEEARAAPLLRPLRAPVVGDVAPVLWVLMGTVGITLLIACANVASLFLVRAEGRARELAVQIAIGAEGRHLALQLLAESLLLGLMGGGGGLALAYGGLRLVTAMAPADVPRLDAVTIDATEDFWAEELGQELFVARTMRYAIRSDRVGTPEFLDAVKRAVWSFQPGQALTSARTLQDIGRGSMARSSCALVMLSLAASVALLLVTVGVYGVIAHVVSQRTHEIGVRVALGAGSASVLGLVLRQGLRLSVAGVTAGLIAASWLTHSMTGLLVGVGSTDALTYAVVAAGLLVVALLASYMPARRAVTIDPLEALRME